MRNRRTSAAARALWAVLCLLLALTVLVPARAAQEQGKVVRVGWYESPFNTLDVNGRRSGYAYEYQQKIAAYTNWRYEYVEGSWLELLRMLENGEIDLLSNVSYTEARSETMLFSVLPMGSENYVLFAPTARMGSLTIDPKDYDGKTIGVNQNSIQAVFLREWAAQNGIRPIIVELALSEAESEHLLDTGELDGYVTLDAYADMSSYTPLCTVGQSDFFFAVSKDRPDLLRELNSALNAIHLENRFYNQQLNDKYVLAKGANAFLSSEDAAWLESHGTVRVGYVTDHLPFCDEDRNGALTGALKDYLEHAATCTQNAKINFSAQAYPTTDKALEALAAGEVDCVFPVNLTPYDCETQGVLATSPVMYTEVYAAVRSGNRQWLSPEDAITVATAAGDSHYQIFLQDNFPNWTAESYDTQEDCYRAVSNGRADCVLMSNFLVARTESERRNHKLSCFTTGTAMYFSFAMRRSDSSLYSILNKTANLASSASVESALSAYSYPEQTMSLREALHEYLPRIILVLVSVSCLVVAIILRQSRKVKQTLEAKLDLQNQLLDQARQQQKADAMITAMASDYSSVYYVDLDRDEAVCYRANKKLRENVKAGDVLHYKKAFTHYANHYVAPQDRAAFLDFLQPERIRAGLEQNVMISLRYLTIKDGQEHYEMLRMAGVRRPEDRDDHTIHAIGAGFTNVDRETRADLAKNKALSNALREAEAASKAKSVFLNTMSHEIRTPMNAIIGLEKLALREPDLTPATREQLEKIDASAKHLLSLINAILDMSRIESGQSVLSEEEFSFREMMRQICVTTQCQCEDKGLRFESDTGAGGIDKIVGDALKLRQVLVNVLDNAVKFTDAPGSVSFTAAQSPMPEGQSLLSFTIRDTGVGIDPHFLPNLFDSFSQEDGSNTNRYGGSGLGLAITRNTLELMGGDIRVESQKDVGTTVTITVPVRRVADSAEQAPAAEAIDLTGLHVLIVEDNELNAEIVADLLDMEEISSEWAENGQLGVERFDRSEPGQFDAVLMDIRMPVMDGITAAREIRKLSRPDAKTVPIIALTANAFAEDVKNCLDAGMDAHLAKPVDIDLLLETLREQVAKRRRS